MTRTAPTLPDPWPDDGERKRAADGDELEFRTRTVAIDLEAGTVKRQIRVTLLHDGAPVAEEEHALTVVPYSTERLLDMLRDTGFASVRLARGYTHGIGDSEHPSAVFLAQK